MMIAPVLILYSMGYRLDIEKMKIVATGGIYVRTFPAADQIIIDSKIIDRPGLFANSIFEQSLLPKTHTVLIKKSGYFDYTKTLLVEETLTTKLENVLLFKENILFSAVTEKTQNPFISTVASDKYLIKNNNLYFSNSAQNSSLTAAQKSEVLIKGLVSFSVQNNNIIWVSTDGFLYKTDINSLPIKTTSNPNKVTNTAIKVKKSGIYKLTLDNNRILLNDNGNLLLLNPKTGDFENFASQIKDANISPDSENLVYFDNNNIYLYSFINEKNEKINLYKTKDIISKVLWMNNDYIVFTSGDKIVISEIDYRGNTNTITISQILTLTDGSKIKYSQPQIHFDQNQRKLYIQSDKNIFVSETLIQ